MDRTKINLLLQIPITVLALFSSEALTIVNRILAALSISIFISVLVYTQETGNVDKEMRAIPISKTDIQGCTQILRATDLQVDSGSDTNIHNELSRWESRAIPNQRLKDAFDILNCFVTADKRVCDEFRADAKKHVAIGEAKWAQIRDEVQMDLESLMKAQDSSSTVPLIPMIQTLCLKTVVRVFQDFIGVTNIAFGDELFSEIADEVNKQWIRSKNIKDIDEWKWSKDSPLHKLMRALTGGQVTPETTPLKVILPGYETLWRVVLRCFFEIEYRGHENRNKWRDILTQFVNSPSMATLTTPIPSSSSELSADIIAKEALRLYPPSRRIYRRFQDKAGKQIDAAADIEALHRQDEVWGAEREKFIPARWKDLKARDVQKHFLAFGQAPFACVAKGSHGGNMPFGFAMICLMVGVLLGVLSSEEFELVLDAEETRGFKSGEPLRTECEDYAGAKLVRKEI